MSTRYVNQPTGIEVILSKAAERVIGPRNVPKWVARLTECMADLGQKWAYISKCGSHVNINMGT